MRPLPQQHGDFINSLAFGGREQADFTAPGLQLHDRQRLVLLGAREFVRFGQNHQELETLCHPWPDDVEQDFIEFGQTVTRVAHEDNGFEIFPRDQIVGHHLLPADFVLLRHGRVAIAGQVGQYRVGNALLAQREQVDMLGAARLSGGKGQLFLLRQGVDAGRFACIGTTDKCNFWHLQGRQEMQLGGGCKKFGGVQPAQGGAGSGCAGDAACA